MQFISSIPIRWVKYRSVSLGGLYLFLILANSGWAQEQVHIAHCAGACPRADEPREIVIHHLYAAAIDPGSGLAVWVAYRVLEDTVGIASLLPRNWQADPLLDHSPPTLTATDEVEFIQPDLSNAQDREYRVNELIYPSVSRGRLTPMTSFAGTPYWQELNNLSNMAPLPENLRTGSWARLDQRINTLAAQTGEVFVVSGPLLAFGADLETPDVYFKLVMAGDRVGAFVFPVDLPPHADHCAQQSTLAAVEAATGLRFFPSLAGEPADLQIDLGCRGSDRG